MDMHVHVHISKRTLRLCLSFNFGDYLCLSLFFFLTFQLIISIYTLLNHITSILIKHI